MVKSKQIIYVKVPTGAPVPGETLKLEEVDIPEDLNSGELLVKNHAISVDPYMRGRMRDPSIQSYMPAYETNAVLPSLGAGEVVKSNNDQFPVGTKVYGMFSLSEYTRVSAETAKQLRILKNEEGLDWSVYVGAAGMPGLTAYWSYKVLGEPKKGETIAVTAASGPVGLLVAQLAKADGLTVIGSVGSDEKVEYCKSVGCFDVVFNYKKEKYADVYNKHKLDIYYDNVGGEATEAALDALNQFGRIVACGQVSQYNLKASERYGIKNTFHITSKCLSWRGFIIGKTVTPEYVKEFYETVPKMIADGKIKIKEHRKNGLDNGELFADMLEGKAEGKAVYVLP